MTTADRLDSLDMFGAALGLPEQILVALEATADLERLPNADDLTSVMVCGMGGSGIGGDLASVVAADRSRLPLVVSKHYELPAWVDQRTLVVASSFSGNTEETISAASEAHRRGCPVVVMSSGGRLAELAAQWDCPHIQLDSSIQMPRAGIGAVTIPLLGLLGKIGAIEDPSEEIRAVAAHLRSRCQDFVGPDSPTLQLARRIGRTIPVVYGAGLSGEVVATRWKGQFNENPKVPSWANRIPELMHNEICGWAQHGDVTRQMISLIALRHDFEHPQNQRRFELVEEISREVVAGVYTVQAAGSTLLEQLFDLILFGDFVTLEAAVAAGVDPGPVPLLAEVKDALARH